MDLVFVGVVTSLLAQWLKGKYTNGTWQSIGIVAAVSFIFAAFYVFLKDTSIWETFLAILIAAGAFYSFIIKRFTK